MKTKTIIICLFLITTLSYGQTAKNKPSSITSSINPPYFYNGGKIDKIPDNITFRNIAIIPCPVIIHSEEDYQKLLKDYRKVQKIAIRENQIAIDEAKIIREYENQGNIVREEIKSIKDGLTKANNQLNKLQ